MLRIRFSFVKAVLNSLKQFLLCKNFFLNTTTGTCNRTTSCLSSLYILSLRLFKDVVMPVIGIVQGHAGQGFEEPDLWKASLLMVGVTELNAF